MSKTSKSINPLERARELALSYLDRRMRSRFELGTYLRRKGFESDVVEATLETVARLGALDDRAFARAFARDRVRLHPRGYILIRHELARRGVDREIVGSVIEEVEAEFPELEMARGLVARRRRRGSGDDDRRRQAAWLRSRGFRTDTIRHILDEWDDDPT